MKCKVCGGAGVIQGQAPGLVSCCPACDGKGFIEQTNEEWFCDLSTEEKAEALARGSCGLAVSYDADEFTIAEIKRRWRVWLKQPHTEKE